MFQNKIFNKKLLVLFMLSFFCLPAIAVDENNYDKEIDKVYKHFFKKYEEKFFTGEDGIEIAYAEKVIPEKNPHDSSRNAIVILPGRTEGYIKYIELAYDLRKLKDQSQKKFNIYLMDHRGQGFSGRLLEDGHKGHVIEFDNYVEDLYSFINSIVLPNNDSVSIIGRSMGGAIAAQLMEQYPDLVERAVLSAPMFQINTYPYTEDQALGAVSYYTSIGFGNEYFPGQGPRVTGTFEESIVTSSEARWYNYEFTILGEEGLYPGTSVGGPTNLWGMQAILATKAMRANASSLVSKILIFQAQMDYLVINPAQNAFCEAAPNCELIVFEGAKHEILNESDSIRDKALAKIKDFIK